MAKAYKITLSGNATKNYDADVLVIPTATGKTIDISKICHSYSEVLKCYDPTENAITFITTRATSAINLENCLPGINLITMPTNGDRITFSNGTYLNREGDYLYAYNRHGKYISGSALNTYSGSSASGIIAGATAFCSPNYTDTTYRAFYIEAWEVTEGFLTGVNLRSDGSTIDKSVIETIFRNAEEGKIPDQPGPDPYAHGGHSGGGGGTGRFSRTGDTIGEHNVPTLSATDAGFITLFAPTAGEMKALASYLWSDLFSIDTFKKIFANPMDAILGLSIVPVSVPTAGSASVKVGNISTGVSMTKASTQYVKLSCGSLEVEEYWGAYLDYSPYTKCEIYLPYIGVHELSVDDVMGKTVKVVYYIDILSGACTAEIYSNNTCLYSFVGQCSASIPITGNDWTNVINGVMQIGASIGSMVASGGLTAPISGAGVAQGLKSVASASSTVTSSKPSVERSGSMSGAGGMLGQQTPYLIITWPRECIPADQNKYIGYPSYVTVNLGEIVGFNIIESIHLENIPATSAELDEIESLLMNGVIF